MAKMLEEMYCKVCGKQLESPDHLHMNENGEPEYLCDDCYKVAEDFVRRGGMKNATRTSDKESK